MRFHLDRRLAVPALLVTIALAACNSQPAPPPEAPATRPPPPACDQARRTLDGRGGEGSFLFEESGTAMVSRRDWMSMSESGRDELIETLAVLAGDSAKFSAAGSDAG